MTDTTLMTSTDDDIRTNTSTAYRTSTSPVFNYSNTLSNGQLLSHLKMLCRSFGILFSLRLGHISSLDCLCRAWAVTFVIFRHVNRSCYLLTQDKSATINAIVTRRPTTRIILLIHAASSMRFSGSLSNVYSITTPCLKNVPPLAWYNFDTREQILIFFGRNVRTGKVSHQQTFYCATSHNLTCASALSGKQGNM